MCIIFSETALTTSIKFILVYFDVLLNKIILVEAKPFYAQKQKNKSYIFVKTIYFQFCVKAKKEFLQFLVLSVQKILVSDSTVPCFTDRNSFSVVILNHNNNSYNYF